MSSNDYLNHVALSLRHHSLSYSTFEEAYVSARNHLEYFKQYDEEDRGTKAVPPQRVVTPAAIRKDGVTGYYGNLAREWVRVRELLAVEVVNRKALQ